MKTEPDLQLASSVDTQAWTQTAPIFIVIPATVMASERISASVRQRLSQLALDRRATRG
jgi:ABC-type phosphate/phosphonate transport system permease subunit